MKKTYWKMRGTADAREWLAYYRDTRPKWATALFLSFKTLSKAEQSEFLFNVALATGAQTMMMLRDHGYLDDDDETVGHA